MTDVKRFMAPGPWITRDLKECVRASDYDTLRAERLAAAERERERLTLLLVRRKAWHTAPCCICGYNGPGYFHPDTHNCARIDAALEST